MRTRSGLSWATPWIIFAACVGWMACKPSGGGGGTAGNGDDAGVDADAGNVPPPGSFAGGCDPNAAGPPKPWHESALAPDGVNLCSRNLTLRAGAGALVYNSLAAVDAAHDRPGMPHGWSFAYDAAIDVKTDAGKTTLDVRWGDGSTTAFAESSPNEFAPAEAYVTGAGAFFDGHHYVVGQNGVVFTFEQTGLGPLLASIKDAFGNETFVDRVPGDYRVAGIKFPTGASWKNDYDTSSGMLRAITFSGGYAVSVGVVAGELRSLVFPPDVMGLQPRYDMTYDGSHLLTMVQGPGAAGDRPTSTFGYDGAHKVAKVGDLLDWVRIDEMPPAADGARTLVIANVYGESGSVTLRGGGVTDELFPDGHERHMSQNPYPDKITLDGRTATVEWDKATGTLTKTTDVLGHDTTYEDYAELAQPRKVTTPDKMVMTFEYVDAAKYPWAPPTLPVKWTRGLGADVDTCTLALGDDAGGNGAPPNPGGHSVTRTCSISKLATRTWILAKDGRVVRMLDFKGRTVATLEYDANWLVRAVTTPFGNASRGRDGNGFPTDTTSPWGDHETFAPTPNGTYPGVSGALASDVYQYDARLRIIGFEHKGQGGASFKVTQPADRHGRIQSSTITAGGSDTTEGQLFDWRKEQDGGMP